MADAFEYKSVYRATSTGADYESVGEFLNPDGADGWECFGVLSWGGLSANESYEIFYLKRRIPPVAPRRSRS